MMKISEGNKLAQYRPIFTDFAPLAKLAHEQSYTAAYIELLEDLRGCM